MIDIATHYSRFRVAERLLLTGHSHQAWPDVGFLAQQHAWLDAAEFVDHKWEHAEQQAAAVRAGFARLLGTAPGEIALGQNTHELVTRWLSALPLGARPLLLTTDAEFHSLRRQLDRLAEEQLEVIRVSARPVATLAERLSAHVNDRTAAVLVSCVLFDTAEIVPHLDFVSRTCEHHGARLLIDAYHHLNVVPFDIATLGLRTAFITGGGYKYCQLGEGNAFLRVPPNEHLRPVLTGWFAEFAGMEQQAGEVVYAPGADAFRGATYDPSSHYRAAAVFGFHQAQRLDAERLRHINVHQISLMHSRFERLDVDPRVASIVPIVPANRAGFLAIRSDSARALAAELGARGVWCDARGDILRLGPAPYLRDDQLLEAIEILGTILTRR
jgi:kynureninase